MDQWEQALLNLANCFGIDKTISYDNNSDLEIVNQVLQKA